MRSTVCAAWLPSMRGAKSALLPLLLIGWSHPPCPNSTGIRYLLVVWPLTLTYTLLGVLVSVEIQETGRHSKYNLLHCLGFWYVNSAQEYMEKIYLNKFQKWEKNYKTRLFYKPFFIKIFKKCTIPKHFLAPSCAGVTVTFLNSDCRIQVSFLGRLGVFGQRVAVAVFL